MKIKSLGMVNPSWSDALVVSVTSQCAMYDRVATDIVSGTSFTPRSSVIGKNATVYRKSWNCTITRVIDMTLAKLGSHVLLYIRTIKIQVCVFLLMKSMYQKGNSFQWDVLLSKVYNIWFGGLYGPRRTFFFPHSTPWVSMHSITKNLTVLPWFYV